MGGPKEGELPSLLLALVMAFELKDTIRFEPIKEHRGGYFVEYAPPFEGWQFAHLQLVYLKPTTPEDAAIAMVKELERWARRFPVPIMVSAFDDTGSVLAIKPTRLEDHALGWIDPSGQIVVHWRQLKNEEIPGEPFTIPKLVATYPDVQHTISTAEDKRKDFEKTKRNWQAVRYVLAVWVFGIPFAIALITQFVSWAAWAATVISVATGVWKLSGIMGWRKPSKRQEHNDAEDLRIRHHHYWCERNPEGFNRLKSEAIEQELRDEIREEAAALKSKKKI